MPKGYSKSIHASVLLLTVFGLFMIISASATVNTMETSRLLFVFVKELGFIIVSYWLMVKFARYFSFSKFKKYYSPILVLSFIFLLLTLAFPEVNGAKAWIHLKVATVQPSEFMKILVVLVLAHSLGEKGAGKSKFTDLAMHPVFIIVSICLIVLVLQNDLGTAMIIAMMALITLMVFANSELIKVQTVLIGLFTLGLTGLLFFGTEHILNVFSKLPGVSDYMLDRFRVSANPFLDRHGASAQIFNGLAAFVSGGLWGVGYGKGFLKFSFIFAAESDSILAIIVEELGVITGFLPIIILYAIIIYQLMKYSFLVDSEKDKAILVGSIAYFFVHFLLNVGGITALIPLTGVPLLFISAGGSSRMAVMIMIGLSQNVIARHNQKKAKV